MLGKYLNGYGNKNGDQYNTSPMNRSNAPIPPGWTDWHVSNTSGYAEYNFQMNDNGAFNRYAGDNNYGVDVLNRDAQTFIASNAHRPFFVEAATFAPHRPFTPAIRNQNDFPGLTEPRDASFDAQNINPPAWLGQRPPLTPAQVAADDAIYRKRAQAVESVDELLADTEATLAKEHLTDRTYIVFSSDNGYHLGQHRLLEGKQTAFDTDIRVPLIVTGPRCPSGARRPRSRAEHRPVPDVRTARRRRSRQADRRPSFVPLLHPSGTAPLWPTVALVEHHGGTKPSDPDSDGGSSNPPSYEAIRISAPHLPGFTGPVESVYVEYAHPAHAREYYDISKDPDEIDNVADRLTPAQKDELHRILEGLVHCHNAASCWAAAMPERNP